jgi:hypothetical protein
MPGMRPAKPQKRERHRGSAGATSVGALETLQSSCLGPLLRREAAEKCEVISWLKGGLQRVWRQAMVNCAEPLHVRKRRLLVVRNRDERRVRKIPESLRKARQVQAAMQCRHGRHAQTAAQRKVQPLSMPMHEVETSRMAGNGFD